MKLPQPGQSWPDQTALFAGIVTPPAGAPWALLLPTDLQALPNQAWGRYGKAIKGADSVFDGLPNTQAMADGGSKLASAVLALPGQCYLPSPLEALMLFAILREQVGTGIIWTSRQCSAGYAWYQYFSSGYQYLHSKDAELRAVPVRRLVLRSFDASIDSDSQEGGAA